MSTTQSAFEQVLRDEKLAPSVRSLQVALQAELLRAGAHWEESLAILRESANHRRAFGSAAEALSWYRSAYHPAL